MRAERHQHGLQVGPEATEADDQEREGIDFPSKRKHFELKSLA